ncbi:MAG: hypothetical protein ISS18_12415 [Bacteroidales bacterium]|nr:hypothetical protein [Bacteroidales bacterium]
MKLSVRIITTTLLILFSLLLFAQSPKAFNYQAVVRDTTGNILCNQNISIRSSIIKGSQSGIVIYSETHSDTTNQFGIISLNIGNGNVISGTFDSINWGNDNYFLKIEIDDTGGTNFQYMGTTQLLSVPYALYSETSGNNDDGDWTLSSDNLYSNVAGNVGIDTVNPVEKLHINGNARIEDTLIFPGYSNQSWQSRGQFLIGERDIKIGYQNDNYGNILIGNSLYGKTIFDLNITGNGNIGIGTDVFHETNTGGSNVCLGMYSGYNLTSGNDNVFLGSSAGEHISTASLTTCIGNQAGNGRNGARSIYIGDRAGYAWGGGGDDNIFMGNYAGFKYGATNSRCIFIGKYAGYDVNNDDNIFIGPFETGRDAAGSKNIFFGYQTGRGWNGSNFLLIDNKNDNSTPFIKGDMENDELEFNADVSVKGNLQGDIIKIDSILNLKEISTYPVSPSEGDLIYYNDTLRFYNGTEWKKLW